MLGACSSYEQFAQVSEEFEIPSRVFRSDYNHTWQAVQQVVKNYDLSVMNQSTGVIKSRWIDNTLEINFTDSFSKNDAVNAAKFKLIINVIKGYRGQNEVSKVTIFKRQMVEQDPLQGFKIIPTDKILENTLLYRIERVLAIDRKLQEIEKQKAAAAEAADF
ncbi:MAG: hypothetical protein J6Y94_03815 [Bacteriovoracaceae bacterium]|nr:hypothetical protein [Bacteriovoracaceae bacterium]